MRKLLVLGGSPFQVPAILQARELGHFVMTCDYLPQNPGHRYAHQFCNVSTTDHAAVLALAKESGIDGILAYASDPAAWTAACVASELALPGNTPECVHTLTNKAAFREFLTHNGFKTPRFVAAECLGDALDAARSIGFPVMVKPCDSSGSKGVTRVDDVAAMESAYHAARHYTRCERVMVEQWIRRRGRQIAGDGLVIDGKLVFGCFGDEHFDSECCAHAPVGESFPGELTATDRDRLFSELQRLFTLLGIRHLVFNLDAMFDSAGDLILIEIGPRSGGNALPQIIHEHTGVDLTDIAIRLALGDPVEACAYTPVERGFHSTWIIHSRTSGRLSGYRIAPALRSYVRQFELLVKPGAIVRKFASAADTLGYALLSFPSWLDMQRELAGMSEHFEPVLE